MNTRAFFARPLSVCLPCLSVTLVCCGQTVGWIKMKLGTQAGLDPGHIVLDGDPAPASQNGHSHPIFCCGYRATTLAGVASFAPISDPSDVGASTAPQPYGLEGPNVAHLQHIVRGRRICKQFANIREGLGYTLARRWAKMAKLQIWHFVPGDPAPCRGPLHQIFLCHFVAPREIYNRFNAQVSSAYHLQKHHN